EPPPAGTTQEVAPGVKWLRMPLPMSLNHINLYLIDDGDGWYVIDTGIRGKESRDLWLQVIAQELDGKPLNAIICTHMHPDHTGQAGFLHSHCRIPLMMSFSEYYQARSMGPWSSEDNWPMQEYFERAGITQAELQALRDTRSQFTPEPEDHPLPGSFIRLVDGQSLQIGSHEWIVHTGCGHSPEHVCLYSRDLRVLLSGDQVLPVITSNVSVHPNEPFGNPMVGWLESLEKFRALIPNDTLVLPAHNMPFYRLHERLQQLIDHHEDRMLILEENCVTPSVAVDMLPLLFDRKLEGHTKIMALGECIAHLHCLMTRNRIERRLENGRYLYQSVDPTLSSRARPDSHEPPDHEPGFV
ncbi:MAG: MBL fold metallo-hydrolase, partial [Pseudomonadales bacterium]|nr:MBL fold metallo-hydrolase [Pseudomonadales bacterium]